VDQRNINPLDSEDAVKVFLRQVHLSFPLSIVTARADDLRASSPGKTGCDFGVFYRSDIVFNEAEQPSP